MSRSQPETLKAIFPDGFLNCETTNELSGFMLDLPRQLANLRSGCGRSLAANYLDRVPTGIRTPVSTALHWLTSTYVAYQCNKCVGDLDGRLRHSYYHSYFLNSADARPETSGAAKCDSERNSTDARDNGREFFA
jgi:hypothetical protein